DELVLRIGSTLDAFVTVVSLAGDSVFVLAPNAVTTELPVAAGRAIEVPDPALREAGLHFRATLPAGIAARTEVVAVVATKHAIPIPAASGSGSARDSGVLTLAEFNQWLIAIPLDERAVAQTTIEVRRVQR